MYKQLLSAFIFFTFIISTNAQKGINYQILVRDAQGSPIESQAIQFNISIQENNSIVFEETHNLRSSEFGVCNFIIGTGTLTNGDWSSIDWSNPALRLNINAYQNNTEIIKIESIQFQMVPLAAHANLATVADSISGLTLSQQNITKWDNYEIRVIELSDSIKSNITTINSKIDSILFNNYISANLDSSTTNELQDIELNDNLLSISNSAGQTVDLTKYLDNTDTQLTESEVDDYVSNNGYITSPNDADTSITNEIQDLKLTGDLLTISDNGNPTEIDLSAYSDDLGDHILTKNIQTDGNWLSYDNVNQGIFIAPGGATEINSKGSPYVLDIKTNRNQFANNGTTPMLKLSNTNVGTNGDASLAFEVTGTTTQTFSIGIDENASNAFKIIPYEYLGSNNAFVMLPTGEVGIGLNKPSEQLDVNGNIKADTLRPTNGIEFSDGTFQNTAPVNQQLTFDNSTGELGISSGNSVLLPFGTGGDQWGSQAVVTDGSISGNGTSAFPLKLTGAYSDDQQLSLVGTKLLLDDSPSVDLSKLNTDKQTLLLADKDLSITGGNTIDLSGLSDNLGNHIAIQNIQTNGNWITNNSTDEEGIFVFKNGRVGFGTNSILTPGNNSIQVNAPTGGAFAVFTNNTTTQGTYFGVNGNGDAIVGNRDAASFFLQTDQKNRLTIDPTGKVGIGTDTPLQKLSIAGTGAVLGTDNAAVFVAKNTAGISENFLIPRWSNNQTYLNYGANGFNIRNNSNDITMFMSNDNKVGIGTGQSSGLGKLNIQHNSSLTSPTITLNETAVDDGSRVSFTNNSSTEAWTLYGRPHDNQNQAVFSLYYSASGSNILSVYGNGNVQVPSLSGGTSDDNLIVSSTGVLKRGSAVFSGSYFDITDKPWLINGASIYRNNNVGIGTVNPKNKLDIGGGAVIGANYSSSRIAPTNGLLVQGNVGVGTISPSQKLDVFGVVRASNSTVNYLETGHGGANSYINHGGAGNLDFRFEGNTEITMTSGGNLGIGTNDPLQKLSIAGTGNVFGVDNASSLAAKNTAGIYETFLWPRWSDNATYLNYGTGGFNIRDHDGSAVTMFMSNNNNVGIGVTNPQQRLDINGRIRMRAGAVNGTIMAGNASGDASWMTYATLKNNLSVNEIDENISLNGNWISNDGDNEGLRVQNNGNVEFNNNVSVNNNLMVGDNDDPLTQLHVLQGNSGPEADGILLEREQSTGRHDLYSLYISHDSKYSLNYWQDTQSRIDASPTKTFWTARPDDNIFEVKTYLYVTGSNDKDHDNDAYFGDFNEGDRIDEDYDNDDVKVSIEAANRIRAVGFIAMSDERIKKNISQSNSTEDLDLLSKIEIVDYNMKDTIAHGTHDFKKVIAQQVKKVYPLAVSTKTMDVVPDIYTLSEVKNGWIPLTENIAIDDTIKVMYDKEASLFRVIEMSEKGFKIDLEFEGEVFVYGHQIHDMHSVDYEAISMLNVSATQEIYRHVQTLKQSNEENENRIKTLEASLSAQQENDQKMEDVLQQLQERLFLLEASKAVGQK